LYFYPKVIGMILSAVNSLVRLYTTNRFKRFSGVHDHAALAQEKVLHKILCHCAETKFGTQYRITDKLNPTEYADRIPIFTYEALYPFIERMLYGESDVLWPGRINFFAKSSGTTNDKSKYIPFTDELMDDNVIASSWDAMGMIYTKREEAKIFAEKSLIMGGSLGPFADFPSVTVGDVSAIMLHRMPWIGRPFYTPDFETALLSNWDEKIARMTRICSQENVVMFGGVPTWTMVLFDKILDFTGKKNMLEVWPNVRTYMHGGVNFDPYRSQFYKYLPTEEFDYVEIYNASEGFFAIQDSTEKEGMLLLMDNGVYYEFIPMDVFDTEGQYTIGIQNVELGVNYALVISTVSGLYRYLIGDTIQFTTINPYRIKITGRTQQYINVFGEELMVSNTDTAITKVSREFDVSIKEYTVAPIFLEQNNQGGHQWLIEFQGPQPLEMEAFTRRLDEELRAVNSDYDAKRYQDMAIKQLDIVVASSNAFHKWLSHKGKLGGQSKIPRLSNSRKYFEEIRQFCQ